MKKEIKKVGSSIGIIFNREESKVYNLEKGKIIEIEIKEDKNA
jgi:antitoxin component of MazEF toxin-antitoxin module